MTENGKRTVKHHAARYTMAGGTTAFCTAIANNYLTDIPIEICLK